MDVIIDNINCRDYGFIVADLPIIPSIKERINTIQVEGRDGTLIEKLGFEDKTITVNFGLIKEQYNNLHSKIRSFIPILLGAKELKFSEDLEVCYKVKSVTFSDITRQLGQVGRFTVNFIVEPFAYMVNDEIIQVTNNKIYNIGTYRSLPYFKIYGQGKIVLNVNSKTITLNSVDGYVELDSDLQICKKDNINKNNTMIGDFPTLEVGENIIYYTGNVNKIEIDRRMRFL